MCIQTSAFLRASYGNGDSDNLIRVNGLTDIDINFTTGKEDVSDFETNQYTEYCPTRTEIEISFNLNMDWFDPGQRILLLSRRNNNAVFFFECGLAEGQGIEKVFGRAFLENSGGSRTQGESPKGSYSLATQDVIVVDQL